MNANCRLWTRPIALLLALSATLACSSGGDSDHLGIASAACAAVSACNGAGGYQLTVSGHVPGEVGSTLTVSIGYTDLNLQCDAWEMGTYNCSRMAPNEPSRTGFTATSYCVAGGPIQISSDVRDENGAVTFGDVAT